MADKIRKTFGNLRKSLQSQGFNASKLGEYFVFTHASGRPMILLPAYKSNQAVRPIHLMMVKKQLTDVGMIEPGEPFRWIQEPVPSNNKPGPRTKTAKVNR